MPAISEGFAPWISGLLKLLHPYASPRFFLCGKKDIRSICIRREKKVLKSYGLPFTRARHTQQSSTRSHIRARHGTSFARMAIFFAVAVVNCGIGVSSAKAGELVFGVGQDNVDDDRYSEAIALQLEYHTDPIFEYDWGIISVFGILEVDDDSDMYAGPGVATLWDISASWFVEASLAAGYYDRGSDSLDLGGNIQFRTLIGLGYRLSKKSGLSLALDHLSNAGIEDTNPGRNAIILRYRRAF
jgi:hypothetical protein